MPMPTSDDDPVNRRRWPNRLLRWAVDPWLDWVFFRLDLNTNGRPSHSKLLSTVAFFFGLIGLGMFGKEVVETCGAVQRLVNLAAKGLVPIDVATLGPLVKSCALMTAALLAYAALVFGMPFGLSGFKVWASTKGGGTVDALGKTAEGVVNAEVAARRKIGGDVEPTE
jgi:hypothetical protein